MNNRLVYTNEELKRIQQIEFGIGENGYNHLYRIAGHSMFTCTPVNYLVKYGIIFAGINFYGFYCFFRDYKSDVFDMIILYLCLIITLSSEAFTLNPLLVCITLYGYMKKTNH